MSDTEQEWTLSIEDLTVAYEKKPVLWDIDLNVPRGAFMAIVGPNGAGKSTLIKTVLGLIKSTSGRFHFASYLGKGKQLKNNIAYVPQSGSVDWDYPATVLDVVIMGTYGKLGWIKRAGKAEKDLALSCIEKVAMTSFVDRQISQLSGGQQQRVFLARALAQQADFYLMDEPFKGVDALSEKAILDLLRQLQKERKTIVVVHHDLQTVEKYFDYVAFLNTRVIASGKVSEVFTDENVYAAYHTNFDLFAKRS